MGMYVSLRMAVAAGTTIIPMNSRFQRGNQNLK